MKLVLIGYMGSGKTSVAKLLGQMLDFRRIDLDAKIEALEMNSISEIFKSKGEIYFRRKEAEVLKQLISSHDKLVIATGGGTPCYGNVMRDLLNSENVITIYLKNSLETLTNRLFPEKDSRPLIAHLESKNALNDFIRKHLFERSFYYSKANLTIECDGLTPKEIVEKILLRLF